MVFSSVTFLTVFFPLVVFLYFLPFAFAKFIKNTKWITVYKNIVLCITSLLFYAWGEPRNIILMLLSIVFNFTVALHIDKFPCGQLKRKLLLIFSIVFNIGLLVFFKYSGFLAENVSTLFNLTVKYIEPALPIGISFYTFQILSYVADVYKGKVKVQRSVLDFALYVSMFPQLIAGPIVQYSIVAEQLAERYESFEKATHGIFIFIKGLAKKVILANTAGQVFESFTSCGYDNMSALGAWSAIVFYAFQIYFDFSGYSDMAIGLGYIFGFDFPDNFNHPYIADSITDFWRRWHITLSSWFRDYIYIPLGGNRCSVKRNIFNLFIVWSLTGLWHGASWNFLLWGLYYFLLLVLEKFLLNKFISRIPSLIRRIVTFILVLFGWVLFVCIDIRDIISFFRSMFGFCGLCKPSDLYNIYSNLVMLLIMAVCSTTLFSYNEKKNRRIDIVIRFIISVLLFAVSIIFLIGDTYNPFLYFRF